MIFIFFLLTSPAWHYKAQQKKGGLKIYKVKTELYFGFDIFPVDDRCSKVFPHFFYSSSLFPLSSSSSSSFNPIYPAGAHCAPPVTYLRITRQIHVQAVFRYAQIGLIPLPPSLIPLPPSCCNEQSLRHLVDTYGRALDRGQFVKLTSNTCLWTSPHIFRHHHISLNTTSYLWT